MTLADIVHKAGLVLRDVGHVRSTQAELEAWVYAGQAEAATMRPDLFAKDTVVPLAAGSRQSAPAGSVAILDVFGNCSAAGALTGRTATSVDKALMDQAAPGWRAGAQKSEFKQWVPGPTKTTFDVYPPADGTGHALISAAPVPPASGEPVLPEEYHMALVDYAVARALSKDNKDETTATRAGGSYQMFKQALQ